jgi:hypothetical protein
MQVYVSTSQTLKAIAYKSGWKDSDVSSAVYAITGRVTSPSFSPPGGFFSAAPTVTLTSPTNDASFRYTIDGPDPTSGSGTPYSGPFSVTASGTIKAIAYKTDWIDSFVTSAVYAIADATAPAEVPSLQATRINAFTVQLSWTEPADADFDHILITRSPGSSSSSIYYRGFTSHTFTDMSQYTSYEITIKTVDSYGNISNGRLITTTALASGSLSISLNSSMPSDLALSFSGEQGSLNKGESMTVQSLTSLSSFDWRLDGISIGTGSSVQIIAANIGVGKHVLVLMGWKDGHLYSSADIVFTATSNN